MKSKIISCIFFILCLVWAIAQLYPLIWMFYSSVKTNPEILRNMMALPKHPNLNNWVTVWRGDWGNITIGRYLFNSVVVTSLSLTATVFLAYLAGYAMARYKFVLNNFIFILLLGSMAIPQATILVPLYIMLKRMVLTESYFGLILPYIAFSLPFAIVLTRAYFATYPKEIEDAAKIDGCSDIGAFFRIVVPSSKTIFATLTVVIFPSLWNEFIMANVIVSSNKMKTLPLGVGLFKGEVLTRWDYTFSSMAIATIPVIVAYFVFQRYIVKGMILGAIKG